MKPFIPVVGLRIPRIAKRSIREGISRLGLLRELPALIVLLLSLPYGSAAASPGAMIVVTTLNEQSLLYKAARVLYRLGVKTPMIRLYDKHHINHFSEDSLQLLLKLSGLKILKVCRHNVPMRSVDMPSQGISSAVSFAISKSAVII